MDGQDEDGGMMHGRPLPLVAVLAGAALLAAGALVAPRIAPDLPLPTLAGGGAAAGLALWIVALVGGLRRGPLWWMFVSLALLVAGGALAGLGAYRIAHAGNAADASSFAELETNPDGTPILPSNPARGPISAHYAQLVRADEQAAKTYAQQVSALNLGTLNSPYLLAQAPALLGKCESIAALEPVAAHASAARAERHAALVRAVDAAELPAPLKQGIAQIAALPVGEDPMLAQERAMLRATGDLCRLLARRGWSNANGFFGFASGADKAAFDAINARRVAIEAERKRIRDADKARFEAGRDQVREALS